MAIVKVAEMRPECIKSGRLTLAEMREKAEALTELYNDGVQSGDLNPCMEYPSTDANGNATVSTLYIRAVIDSVIGEYTAMSRKQCFDELKQTEDPMLEAVTRLTFPTIRLTEKKIGEGELETRVASITDSEKYIDLLKLHKEVAGGIGYDKRWSPILEQINFLLTARKAKELGIDPTVVNDSYAMSDIARQIDLGKNPVSNTNLLKTLQGAVTAMLGEGYKATSHDVNFLLSVYSRKNRAALTVSCANHKYMRQYVAEICHRIVTGKSYNVEFKKVRQ